MNTHVRHCSAGTAAQLASLIATPEINLLVLASASEGICEGLSAAQNLLAPGFQFWAINQPLETISARLASSLLSLGPLDEELRADLFRDLNCLLASFTIYANCLRPFVSLRCVDADYLRANKDSVSACFHRDSTVLTLTKTYLGTGSQWVENHNVKREYFASHWKAPLAVPLSTFLYKPEQIHTLATGAVALLKGEFNCLTADDETKEFLTNFLPPAAKLVVNQGAGLIHRGPPLGLSERRLVLNISSFNAL